MSTSKKKNYTLTSGLLGRMRNGSRFVSSYHKDFGHYVTFSDGATVAVSDQWDEKTLQDLKKIKNYDIVALWKPNSLSDISRYLADENFALEYCNLNKPTWVTAFTEKPKEEPKTPEFKGPKITTEVFISINDKPVDLNNLTEEERKVLTVFGVLENIQSMTDSEEEE